MNRQPAGRDLVVHHRRARSKRAGADDERHDCPLILTKLRPPALGSDLVARPRLLELLDGARDTPLTVVSAPAGYGKSVLVSQWVEGQELPCAWCSLDESSSDLRRFLDYLLTALEEVAPGSCPATRELSLALELPSIRSIGAHLINELDSGPPPFILVLDDYHRVQPSSDVHELVRLIVSNPPTPLHLVISTRRDPPLPAAVLWGERPAVSVRLSDLKFSREETTRFLSPHVPLGEEALAQLDEELEGWAMGLRLFSLALRGVDDPDRFARELRGGPPRTREYLLHEVLARQPKALRIRLLQSSICDHFCAGLLDALFAGGPDASLPGPDGAELARRLEHNDLFAIHPGGRSDWFRYHHCFRRFLARQLEREIEAPEIAELHARASRWFESQGLIDESIHHALRSPQPSGAADIVARHRYGAEEGGRWCDLERWLDLLPEMKRPRADLLLARMFLCIKRYRLDRLPPMIERAESLLAHHTGGEALRAELDVFRGLVSVWLHCDGAEALRRLGGAARGGLKGSVITSGRLEFWLAGARHLVGEGEQAIREIEGQIGESDEGGVLFSRRMWALGCLRMLSGDLPAAERQADWMITSGPEMSSLEAWGHYFRANALFQADRREEALQSFLLARERRFVLSRRFTIDAMAGLALTHHFLQRPKDAADAIEALFELVRETGEPHQLILAESVRARLSMLEGDVEAAVLWADSLAEQTALDGEFFFLEVPALTQAKAWVASGTAEVSATALARLAPLRRRFEDLNFIAQLIEVCATQAVAHEIRGETDHARAAVSDAIALAAPRGFVRPFVEAGPAMAALLDRTGDEQLGHRQFVRHLLAALAATSRSAQPPTRSHRSDPPGGVDSPLTNRQLDVLTLLAQRLHDKEIAAALDVAPATVNQHLKQIYRKLDVHCRMQAVHKAVALGLLDSPHAARPAPLRRGTPNPPATH